MKQAVSPVLVASISPMSFCSDSLVEEVAGGKSEAISYIERDEDGYLASEVSFCLFLYAKSYHVVMHYNLLGIVDGSIEAVVINGSVGCLCWDWSC